MTTTCDFSKNTGWEHDDNKKFPRELIALPLNTHLRTITLQCHPKQLNPIEAFLFDIFSTVILADIEIWISGLEHRYKFKAVVSCINSMYNPVLFVIPHDLWTPYHYFGVFRW